MSDNTAHTLIVLGALAASVALIMSGNGEWVLGVLLLIGLFFL